MSITNLNIQELGTDELKLIYKDIGEELENRYLRHTRIIKRPNHRFHIARMGINQHRDKVHGILGKYDIHNTVWNSDSPHIIQFDLSYCGGVTKRRGYDLCIDKFDLIILDIESLFKEG